MAASFPDSHEVCAERKEKQASCPCAWSRCEGRGHQHTWDSLFPKHELEIFSKCIPPPLQNFIFQTVREDHAARWKHSTVALNSVTIIYGFYLRLEPLSLALVGKMREKYLELFWQSSKAIFLTKSWQCFHKILYNFWYKLITAWANISWKIIRLWF